MSCEVTVEMDGPDVTGNIIVTGLQVTKVVVQDADGLTATITGDPLTIVSFKVFEGDAAPLFGQLGQAIEVINANADPS